MIEVDPEPVEVRRIIVPAVAVGLVGATVALWLAVRGDAAVELDEEQLARAADEHRRSVRTKTPTIDSPRLAAAVRGESPKRSSDAENESPAGAGQPEPPRPHPRPSATPPSTDGPVRRIRVGDGAGDGGTGDTLRDRMRAVNKLYDRGRFDEARNAAFALLEEEPTNRRMLRVVVSASCIMFEPEVAREHYSKLPVRDRRTMKTRCERYGVELD